MPRIDRNPLPPSRTSRMPTQEMLERAEEILAERCHTPNTPESEEARRIREAYLAQRDRASGLGPEPIPEPELILQPLRRRPRRRRTVSELTAEMMAELPSTVLTDRQHLSTDMRLALMERELELAEAALDRAGFPQTREYARTQPVWPDATTTTRPGFPDSTMIRVAGTAGAQEYHWYTPAPYLNGTGMGSGYFVPTVTAANTTSWNGEQANAIIVDETSRIDERMFRATYQNNPASSSTAPIVETAAEARDRMRQEIEQERWLRSVEREQAQDDAYRFRNADIGSRSIDF